jgi:hypothetical protein
LKGRGAVTFSGGNVQDSLSGDKPASESITVHNSQNVMPPETSGTIRSPALSCNTCILACVTSRPKDCDSSAERFIRDPPLTSVRLELSVNAPPSHMLAWVDRVNDADWLDDSPVPVHSSTEYALTFR